MTKKKASDPSETRIANIPQFEKMQDSVSLAKTLETWVPRLAPLARLLGIDTSKVAEAAGELSRLAPKIQQHVTLADRFNALYRRHGWIAHTSMNIDVMNAAVEAGNRDDLNAGEQTLVEQFTGDRLRALLQRMSTLANFADRSELARLTMIDYLEGRYHACVPNLLMLIDGLASDAASSRESFFSKDADLTAWNTMEGHPSGLAELSKLMQARRKKRRTEPLMLPLRHGILHGRDLGFATKPVAAKCWAALFAVGDWARTVECGEQAAPVPQPKKPLGDLLREISSRSKTHKEWEAWKPRGVVIDRDIPRTGIPADYKAGTPEHALVTYLSHWAQRGYEEMARLVTIGPERTDPRARLRGLGAVYRPLKLTGFELRVFVERGPRVAHFEVECAVPAAGSAGPAPRGRSPPDRAPPGSATAPWRHSLRRRGGYMSMIVGHSVDAPIASR